MKTFIDFERGVIHHISNHVVNNRYMWATTACRRSFLNLTADDIVDASQRWPTCLMCVAAAAKGVRS